MKPNHLFFVLLIASLAANFYLYNRVGLVIGNQTATCTTPTILYSGQDKITQTIVNKIFSAKKFVYFSIYTFTDPQIADALIGAKLRGLDVRGILDATQITLVQEKTQISKMKKYGIVLNAPIKQQGIIHAKLLVTDAGFANGSFNWTYSAQTLNDEVEEIGGACGEYPKYLQIIKEIFKKYGSPI